MRDRALARGPTPRRCWPPAARRRARSATTPCCWRSTSSTAATSRCRCCRPPRHVLHLSSATARPSAATRRSSRRRRRRPSTPALRERLTSAAVALAAAVGYTNAGTVEFLLDADRRLLLPRDEHPPPGRAPGHRADLPGPRPRRAQLRIASGEPLSFAQDDLRSTGTRSRRGSTPRTRYGGFLPQAGTAPRSCGGRGLARAPACGSTTRSSPARWSSRPFDPMLGKVVVPRPRPGEPPRRALVGGPRRHQHPRAHHEHRLPARAGRRRGVPRRHDRHGLARPR